MVVNTYLFQQVNKLGSGGTHMKSWHSHKISFQCINLIWSQNLYTKFTINQKSDLNKVSMVTVNCCSYTHLVSDPCLHLLGLVVEFKNVLRFLQATAMVV